MFNMSIIIKWKTAKVRTKFDEKKTIPGRITRAEKVNRVSKDKKEDIAFQAKAALLPKEATHRSSA